MFRIIYGGINRKSRPAFANRDSSVVLIAGQFREKTVGGKQKNPTISGEDSQKQPCRRYYLSSSPPAVTTHFCRWRYPQLRVDVAPFVSYGLPLGGEPFIFLPLPDQATRTTIHFVATKLVGRNGDVDIPVGCLRRGKSLHWISF